MYQKLRAVQKLIEYLSSLLNRNDMVIFDQKMHSFFADVVELVDTPS